MFTFISILCIVIFGDAGIDSLDVRLEQTQIHIEELEDRHASNEEILLGIHDHLAVAREYFNELAVREARITMDIHQIDQKWFLTDSARSELRQGVEDYILFLYTHRRLVESSVLFAPGGMSRYLRRMFVMDHLANIAINRMLLLEQSGDSLSQYRDSLEILVTDVRFLREQMEGIQERIYREEERQVLLRRSLESEIVAARDSADAMAQRRQQLSAFVTTLTTSTTSSVSYPSNDISSNAFFSINKGAVNWPLRGTIIRAFGVDQDPVYGTETISDGISIAVNSTSERVHTIGPGTIIYAREYLSLGRMVILDHLDGFYSIYAHLGSLDVERGESVATGTLLGQSGPLPGGRSGCYLEIRRAGTPVNPLEYLE